MVTCNFGRFRCMAAMFTERPSWGNQWCTWVKPDIKPGSWQSKFTVLNQRATVASCDRQCQAWAWRLSPTECRLAPHCETDWSTINGWIVRNFHIFIVSAVNICKQCLQTASASAGTLSPRPLDFTGGLPSPRRPGLEPSNEKFLSLPLVTSSHDQQ